MRPVLKTIPVGPLDVNCYVFGCSEHKCCYVIDPGDNVSAILSFTRQEEMKILGIINTHAHADHIGGNLDLKSEGDIPLFIHKDDAEYLTSDTNNDMASFYGLKPSPSPDKLLSDGETVEICDHFSFKVIHTPGHTPGGICLLSDEFLFSGDTLFASSVGRSDLPGGSHETLIHSIKSRLLPLPESVRIFPGHGQDSTIGDEKQYNPFLR